MSLSVALRLIPAVLLSAAPAIVVAQVAVADASRLLVGDAAIEIRSAESGLLRLAVADSEKVLVVSVLARDAKRWSDSVALLLRVKAVARRVPREWRVMLEEPGLQAGTLVLTRRDDEGGSHWSLFVSDQEFEEINITLAPGEVRALLAAMQRRVKAALQPPPKRSKQRARPPAPLATSDPTTLSA